MIVNVTQLNLEGCNHVTFLKKIVKEANRKLLDLFDPAVLTFYQNNLYIYKIL